jgi:hypothetical protein
MAGSTSIASTLSFDFAESTREEPLSYGPARIARFARCPLSYRLHYLDRLPADVAPERDLLPVVARALDVTLRAHVDAHGTGPLDARRAADAFREAWATSDLHDHALFVEGLDLVARWVAREGAVDGARVLGIRLPFTVHFDGVALRSVMDRVDRIGDDAIRVRQYTATRLPPRREDAEASLDLAACDFAARQLWPWARRVELSLELLRHDVAIALERTAAEREATRQYVLATVAQIRGGAMPARPGTACARCDHRSQCPAWADARAGQRVHAGASAEDLPAVVREREELAVVLRALGERKDALDGILRAELEHAPELCVEGHRYVLNVAMRREYPLEETLAALAEAGVSREEGLSRLGAVDGGALKALLASLRDGVPPPDLAALQERLDAVARCSPVTRLTVREVRS